MGTKSQLTDEQLRTIEAMRSRGRSCRQIGDRIGVSEKLVSWTCLRLGIEPPTPPKLRPNWHLVAPAVRRGNHVVRAFTPEEDNRLLELEARGLSYTEIGRVLGRKFNSVRGRLLTLARREERAAS